MRNNLLGMTRAQQIIHADKATKVRMQLAVLLHAQKYQQVDDNAHKGCNVPFCQIGRDVWKHIKTCTQEIDCSEPRCKVSREILTHWEMCSKSQLYCKVCTPLKVAKQKQPKKLNVPDCQTSRNLIRHYKDCTSMDCKRCEVLRRLKRRLYGSRHLLNQRVCHSGLLKHSCRCQDKSCKIPMCIKMKRALTHTNVCRSMSPDTMVCQGIAIFCLNHSITCTEPNCILAPKAQCVNI